ncbi:hypothetical protein BTO09_04525 [Gilvibacter sp. SZ-19]|uniref:tetratricopeptide repeat protein n=1 Tax=unclassified Gilvibacter TaxID=2625242 RepID=UPI000B3C677C|nr:hypothetical protein [Gilvibacter sp. SZ-19]ARV11650.1 hypothetical protein BTO09_04525 [Gilvibacter sp. SZ-19]
MKIKQLLLVLFIALTSSTIAQIDANITDLNTNKTVAISDLYSEYNLDRSIPTLIITWSGEWCAPCIDLINRYHSCDLSMLNLITINVDAKDRRDGVLNKGYHRNWTKSLNFHANLGGSSRGLDNIFNVSSAPLVIYMINGYISDALVSFQITPYKLVESGRINDIGFIWNNSSDLNSLAWSYYENVNDQAKLQEAIGWVNRSIALDENYHNVDTHAALLFKTGKYTEALKRAKDAIEIGKQTGVDYSASTDLINQIIEKL